MAIWTKGRLLVVFRFIQVVRMEKKCWNQEEKVDLLWLKRLRCGALMQSPTSLTNRAHDRYHQPSKAG